MKVKKFTAKTMLEAMQQIRKELGSEAVILQSKEVKKGGVLGFFKNKRIEVVAALDSMPIKETTVTKESTRPSQPPIISQNQTNDREVLEEIKYLKELIEKQALVANSDLPPLYTWAQQYLLDQEVNETIATSLLEDLIEQHGEEGITSKQEMKVALRNTIEEKLTNIPAKGLDKDKQIIQFVGPTGVGKTTTLAKVAAKSILEEKKKVALITMDTYRIAAIDQLKTYARILDVPIEVAYTTEDYRAALQKFKQYDQIFVDTAGRNFRNPQYVYELERMLEIEQIHVQTILVLSLTAKSQDILDIYKQFEPLSIEKIIFSKLDETLTYGSIFNICLGEKKQILYFTNGQNVPDDLVEPNQKQMVKLLLSRYDDDD